MTRVFTAGYHGENDEKSQQERFGAVVRNVCSTHRSRTNRETISFGKGFGATHRIRSVVAPSQIKLQF